MPGELKKQLKAAKKAGKLPELDLSGNGLKNLDKVQKDIEPYVSTVTSLDLSFNALSTFPTLSSFTSLTTLNLAGNALISIDNDSVTRLVNLQELNVTGNPVIHLGPSVFALTRLQKLLLNNAKLTKLDPLIGQMVKLEELHLMGNPLSSLPPNMGKLTCLEILDLFGCSLAELPSEFAGMTRLMELNLGANKLTSLPVTIGNMTRLSHLNLQNNQLTDLPRSIGQCIGLGHLGSGINIAGNPITDAEMRKKAQIGADHLLDYLEKRLLLKGNDLFPEATKSSPSLPSPPSPPRTRAAQMVAAEKQRPKSTEIPAFNPVGSSPPAPVASRPYLVNQGRAGSAPEIIPKRGNIDSTRNSAINTIMNDSRPKLIKLQQTIAASKSVTDLMPLAKAVRELKAAVDLAKNIIPEVQPPVITQQPDEDKLTTFKKATAGALEYVAITMRALKDVIEKTEDETKVSNLAHAAEQINASIPSV